MSEYTNKSEFPNEINLGRTETVPDYAAKEDSPPTKKRTYYPSLYISGVQGLGDLPKEGYALIYFKRKRLSITEGADCGSIPCSPMDEPTGKEETSYSADLEIQEICLPDDESDDHGDALDKMAEKAGLSVRANGPKSDDESDADEDDDSEEEEGD